MSLQDASVILKETPEDNGIGVRRGIFDGYKLREWDVGRFVDVDMLSVQYLDERLVKVEISYRATAFRGTGDFVEFLSEKFDLPKQWKGGSVIKELVCDDFTITALASGSGAQITLTNTKAQKIIDTRREEAKEKRRRSFTP